jgi:hypothetical protein
MPENVSRDYSWRFFRGMNAAAQRALAGLRTQNEVMMLRAIVPPLSAS